jgi:hypothetical protein
MIREALEEYRSHLTTDDVVKFYRMAGKPEPRSYYDIKMIARAYEQTPDGRSQIQQDIRANTVQGLISRPANRTQLWYNIDVS